MICWYCNEHFRTEGMIKCKLTGKRIPANIYLNKGSYNCPLETTPKREEQFVCPYCQGHLEIQNEDDGDGMYVKIVCLGACGTQFLDKDIAPAA